MQISQMVLGILITVSSYHYKSSSPTCSVTTSSLVSGGVMYGSYLVLFVAFAIGKYWRGKTVGGRKRD